MTHIKPLSSKAHSILCGLPISLLILLFIGSAFGGAWLLLPFAFAFVLVPILDSLSGWQARSRYQASQFSAWQKTSLQWLPRLYVIFYLFALFVACLAAGNLTSIELLCLVISFSLISAVAFAACHELMHRRDKIAHYLQAITTVVLFYPHFKIIHTASHHLHIGTPTDLNTAWANEGFWSFWRRTIPGSALRSWQLEKARLIRQKATPLAMWYRNKLFYSLFVQTALLGIIYGFFGPAALGLFVAQVIGAQFIFESVNYLQHFGLLREKATVGKADTGNADGFEKTQAKHSWDSYPFFTSYLTFMVGHHAFHHLQPNKPYYLLEPQAEAINLPLSYFWAIPQIAIPPLWRHVTRPLLAAHAPFAAPSAQQVQSPHQPSADAVALTGASHLQQNLHPQQAEKQA